MSLRTAYTWLAPIYDALIERATAPTRRRSLSALPSDGACRVFINGIGSGLDLPWLESALFYTGLDLTHAMLKRALPRSLGLNMHLVQGDAQCLPFRDACFDHAVLHLILAMVPQPLLCLAETARVVKRGGMVLILDKFLRPGQAAPLRRLLNPLSRRVATRLDVVFEQVAAGVPQLALRDDEPALAGGWFRLIRLEKID